MMVHRFIGLRAALAFTTLMVATPAHANPIDAFELGARSMALGGAVVASVEDASATYYNPAALASEDTLRLELGYSFVHPMLKMGGKSSYIDPSQALQIGLVVAGEILERRVGFGLSIHMPDRLVTRVRSLPQRQPRFALYDNRPQRIVITAAAGFEIIDGLSIGAGVTFLSNARGVLDITGDVGLFDEALTDLRADILEDLSAVRYASAGIRYRNGPWRVGAAFRDEFELRLDVDVIIRGDILADADPDVPPLVEDASFVLASGNSNLFSPRQVVLGFGYSTDDFTVEANLSWLQWSRFPAPTATVSAELDIPGLPFGFPPTDTPIDPDFHDIFIPRVGVEGVAFRSVPALLTLRGGYVYEPTPAPEQTGATNYLDMEKHRWSFGLGLELRELSEILPGPIHIDISAMALWLTPRTHHKTDPADPVGDITTSGWMVGVNAAVSVVF